MAAFYFLLLGTVVGYVIGRAFALESARPRTARVISSLPRNIHVPAARRRGAVN